MGLYKRNKIWWISYSIFGKRIRESTKTTNKKLALQIYNKRKNEILKYKFNLTSSEKITFFQLIEKYEEYSKNNKISYSTEKFRFKLLKEFFGNIPIIFIKTENIEKLKEHLLNSGREKATVNRYLALLKNMFNKSYEWYGIPVENPVKKVKLFKEEPRLRYLKQEELEKLLFYAENHLKDLIILALYTGARLSELLSLKWDDIDFKNKLIKIKQKKTAQEIYIPLSEKLEEYLKTKKLESEFIIHYRGKKIKSVKRAFLNLVKKSGIKDFKFHDLRHTAATYLYLNGVSIYTIQRILGHRDIETTLKYTHIPSEHLKEEIEKLKYPIEIITVGKSEPLDIFSQNNEKEEKNCHKTDTNLGDGKNGQK